jgi:hypothetical protein
LRRKRCQEWPGAARNSTASAGFGQSLGRQGQWIVRKRVSQLPIHHKAQASSPDRFDRFDRLGTVTASGCPGVGGCCVWKWLYQCVHVFPRHAWAAPDRRTQSVLVRTLPVIAAPGCQFSPQKYSQTLVRYIGVRTYGGKPWPTFPSPGLRGSSTAGAPHGIAICLHDD